MATYPYVIPMLVYRDIQAAHDFLVEAFGFETGTVYPGPDGKAVHGEMQIGDTTIWMHRETDEHGLAPPLSMPRLPGGLVVRVADVDAHFARAKAAGARIDKEPVDQPYGQREYGARDPEGHRWWFATPIATPAGSS